MRKNNTLNESQKREIYNKIMNNIARVVKTKLNESPYDYYSTTTYDVQDNNVKPEFTYTNADGVEYNVYSKIVDYGKPDKRMFLLFLLLPTKPNNISISWYGGINIVKELNNLEDEYYATSVVSKMKKNYLYKTFSEIHIDGNDDIRNVFTETLYPEENVRKHKKLWHYFEDTYNISNMSTYILEILPNKLSKYNNF